VRRDEEITPVKSLAFAVAGFASGFILLQGGG
jgi:hypothetical protein